MRLNNFRKRKCAKFKIYSLFGLAPQPYGLQAGYAARGVPVAPQAPGLSSLGEKKAPATKGAISPIGGLSAPKGLEAPKGVTGLGKLDDAHAGLDALSIDHISAPLNVGGYKESANPFDTKKVSSPYGPSNVKAASSPYGPRGPAKVSHVQGVSSPLFFSHTASSSWTLDNRMHVYCSRTTRLFSVGVT